MSSINLEGLEIKEATPSIAPSNYESLPYTKKWRMLIALLIGVGIIGVCVLVFYLSAEAKKSEDMAEVLNENGKLSILATDEIYKSWRDNDDEECLISLRDSCPEDYGEKPVLLLVLGGLRPDQVSEIPALGEFVKCGSSAKSLVPSYPTFDYPNLYSIATGLYSESHGIVSNEMYDKNLHMNFSVGSASASNVDWWGGEPIWNTAAKSGIKTATYLWPGSNIKIQGSYPTYWQKDKVDFVTRIKKVADWVDLKADERPQLIMIYYEQPVKTSQEYGPFSPRTVKELAEINLGLDELMTLLDEEGLINCVDIIVASDHGVSASACDDSIYIDELLDNEEIPGRLYTGTVGRIDFSDDADKDTVSSIIKKLKCSESSLRALEKNEVPVRYHYTNNPRIGELILDARSGSRISTEKNDKCLDGEYGYDTLSRSMQGVFVAHGPSFKTGFSTDSYRNVEIYNLLSHLLQIEPSPNNGTRGSLLHLLKPSLVADSMFEKPEVTYLKESLKPLPSRSNKAVLGKVSEVDLKSTSCPCVQESQYPVTHVEISEKASSVENVEASPMSSSTSSSTTTTTTSTTTTTTEATSSSSTSTTTTTEIYSEITVETSESSSSSTSLTSSTSTSEESIDSGEIEITSPISEVVHSASSRALESEVVLLDSLNISNTTDDTSDHLHIDEPSVDFANFTEEHEGLALNSTLEGTHYVVDNVTNEFDNDSDSDLVQITETNTTYVEKLPEPRHIAEIIFSHEDIRKALEEDEAIPVVSHVTESELLDTIPMNENETLPESNTSQATIVPSEGEDTLTDHKLLSIINNDEIADNNDTTEELNLEMTTELSLTINLEEREDTATDSPILDVEKIHADSPNTEENNVEAHTETQMKSYTENIATEKLEDNTDQFNDNIGIEYFTELQEENTEIPVVTEQAASETIFTSEHQAEHNKEHDAVENKENIEIPVVTEQAASEIISTSEAQVEHSKEHTAVGNDEYQELIPNEEQVGPTEITSLQNEDTASEGVERVGKAIIIDDNSHTKQESETIIETDLEEIVNVPETSTPSLESSSETVQIHGISEPKENIEELETSTLSVEISSHNIEIQAVSESKENTEALETSTPNLQFSSENIEIQAIPEPEESPVILETSTASLESISQKVEIHAIPEPIEETEVHETSTPSLEFSSEKGEILQNPDEDEGIESPVTSAHSLEFSTESIEMQAVTDPNEIKEEPETSTNIAESENEKIEILPIPDSLKSMSLVKEPKEHEIKDTKLLSSLHCPWGFPSYSAPEVSSDTLNILPHSSHIIGFPESLSLGVWTSFTLNKHRLEELHKARPTVPEGVYVSPEDRRNKRAVGCWTSDSRLQRSSSDQCSRTLQMDLYNSKNVSLRQLFPEDLEFPDILNKEGFLLSNLAPVRLGYEEGPRSTMINAVKKWAKQRGPVNVVHGPVFDYDNDGKRDSTLFLWDTVKPLIPSGYYFVVTICNETKDSESSSEEDQHDAQVESLPDCPLTNLNVYSFIFPNTLENEMCLLSPREYLQYYMASLADVEEATSLYFFRNMEYKHKVQIRARQPLRIPSI